MRVVDGLADTPAQITGSLGATRFVHPEAGSLELFCQTLLDPDAAPSLLIFTATPGTPRYDKLALLRALGTDTFAAD